MVSWWPGDGNANDIQDGNNGTLHGGVTFVPGMVAQAFNFDGAVTSYVEVPDASSLNPSAITLDAWVKVRDASGELAWIEAKNLAVQRVVMVKVARAEVRRAPEESAPVVFVAEQDVLLEVIDTADNWAHVKHRDGSSGYIRIIQVWGL